MATGRMLNINLNEVSPSKYNGWDGRLSDTHLDSKSFTDRLANKFECYSISDKSATISAVINAFKDLAQISMPDDLVIITYSGHGAIDPSSTYMENELTMDQAWCLFDGLLKDNQIHKLLTLFKKGVRVVLFSFCCHSGSMYKSLEPGKILAANWVPKFMPRKQEETKQLSADWTDSYLQKIGCKQDIVAHFKYFGSCQNNQYSYSTGFGDAGCIAWWKAWETSKKTPYVLIFKNIFRLGLTPAYQTPVYQNLSKNREFNNEYAFKI